MRTWERLRAHRGFTVGLALGGLVVVLGFAGPLFVGDPDATDYTAQLRAPEAAHWLGTDGAGRDVLTRTLVATRSSLTDALLVAGLTTLVGVVIGGVAGYHRGPVDAVLSRIIDVLLGLPDLVIALAIVGALGVGRLNLLLALVVTQWGVPARVTRALVLASHTRLDVIAARMAGVPDRRILVGHVLPGTLAQVLVLTATGFGMVVLSLAGLSFLGLGAQPPTAQLGQMLADSRGDLPTAPWLAAGPTVVIALTVGAGMLISEALRDARAIRPGFGAPTTDSVAASATTERSGAVERSGAAAPVAVGDPPPVLVLDDVQVRYPNGFVAVRTVSVSIATAECLAVIGESGCGKTTLARAILQLLPPDTRVEGAIRVAGSTLPLGGSDLRELRGRRVGYVAQDPFASFDPLRPVGDHLRQAWCYHRLRPPADLAERMAALGVTDAAERLRDRPSAWSGGMLQRASIAAATAHRPLLVVADEPTSALDAHLADDALRALRHTGAAVLLISHDLRLVARHADRIAVMRDGEIVESGPAADLTEDPTHPYTRALLAATAPVGAHD